MDRQITIDLGGVQDPSPGIDAIVYPGRAGGPTPSGAGSLRAPPADDDPRYERGWLVGLIAGCARGVVAGRRRALHIVLEARFGPLSPDDLRRLARAGATTLDVWICRAAVADELAEIWAPLPRGCHAATSRSGAGGQR